MTAYRLNLTGEYEGRILADCVNVRLQLPDGGTVTVPMEWATEVKPQLEPPDGFIGMIGDEVWERDDLAEQEGDAGEGEHWWRMGDAKAHTWADVAQRAPEGLIRLVPDPADDAPELPWSILDGDLRLLVEAAGEEIRVAISTNLGHNLGVRLSHWHGPQFAAAALAAQRQAQENEQANRTGAAREVEQ